MAHTSNNMHTVRPGLQAFLPTIDQIRPRALTIASWVFQIACAAILLQTLYFKFPGAPEAKYNFTTLASNPSAASA